MKTQAFRFKLPCGHLATPNPFDPYAFMTLVRQGCMRCHLEAKANAKLKSQT